MTTNKREQIKANIDFTRVAAYAVLTIQWKRMQSALLLKFYKDHFYFEKTVMEVQLLSQWINGKENQCQSCFKPDEHRSPASSAAHFPHSVLQRQIQFIRHGIRAGKRLSLFTGLGASRPLLLGFSSQSAVTLVSSGIDYAIEAEP